KADAVLLPAGGAGLVVGVLVRVEPGVDEDAQYRGVVVAPDGAVPVQGGGVEVEIAAAGGFLGRDLRVLLSGGDVQEEGPEAAVLLRGGLADGVGAEVEVVADGAGGGAPAGAAAVAAVDRGQGEVLVLGEGVRPEEGGGGGDGAVHAGDLPQPQVRFEVREGVPRRVLAGPFVGERGEQRGHDVASLGGVGRPREDGGGELAELGGAGGLAKEVSDEGMGEEQVAGGVPVLGSDGAGFVLARGAPERVEQVGGEGVGVDRLPRFEMAADGGSHRGRGGPALGAEHTPLPRVDACSAEDLLPGGADELLEVHAGLGDHGVLADAGAEDGAGEVEHGGGGIGPVAEGGGGGDGGELHAAGCDL